MVWVSTKSNDNRSFCNIWTTKSPVVMSKVRLLSVVFAFRIWKNAFEYLKASYCASLAKNYQSSAGGRSNQPLPSSVSPAVS